MPKKISSYARRMRELTDSVSRRNRKIHDTIQKDGSGEVVRHDEGAEAEGCEEARPATLPPLTEEYDSLDTTDGDW